MRGFFCALFAGIICLESLCGSQFREDRITDNEPTYAIRYETGKSDLTQELKLYAQGAVLLDADSGRVLYGKNETIPMAMASTTKIMTCILVLENAKVDETVSVSAYAATMPKVKLYVKCGEHYTVRELLFSLMLESHNDSAVVLGEYIGGKLLGETGEISEHTGEESKAALHRFAQAMNEKAEEIGCEDTWFITPNGLDATETLTLSDGSTLEREHHTTAKDLAEILRYCMKTSPQRDLFLEITGTQDYSFTENGRFFQCHNHNAFLQMMDGAFTGKTGFTNKAGYCYVGALKRDGKCLIVALLACGWPNHKTYKWSDSRELFTYGLEKFTYRSFEEETFSGREQLLMPIPVLRAQNDALTEEVILPVEPDPETEGVEGLLMGPDENVEILYRKEPYLTAPVEAGECVGEISYLVDGRVWRRERLTAAKDVEAIDFVWCGRQILLRLVARHDHLGTKADTCQEHLHLRRCRILCLIQNDKRIIKGTSSHISKRGNLDQPALHILGKAVCSHDLIQRVVERPQIRVNFALQISRQETEFFTRLNRRTRQDNTSYFIVSERGDRHRHCQISLTGSCRSDAEYDHFFADLLYIFLLSKSLGLDGASLYRVADKILIYLCKYLISLFHGK